MAKKKVPNPNGKKGGKKHQAKVNNVADDIESRGLDVIKELYFKLVGKNKRGRFVDVAGFDKTGQLKELHQIGKRNKNGTPVKRERNAIEDLEGRTKIKVKFHSYNIFIIIALISIVGIVIYYYN